MLISPKGWVNFYIAEGAIPIGISVLNPKNSVSIETLSTFTKILGSNWYF